MAPKCLFLFPAMRETTFTLPLGSNSRQSPRGDGSRLGEMKTLRHRSHLPATCSGGQPSPASSTSFLEPCWSPKTLDLSARIIPLPALNSQNPLAEAGAGQGRCQGLVGGLTTTPCPAGARLQRPARLGGRRSFPPLQAPSCAGARGPRGACWGWARLPSGGKFWVWVPSSWAHTAHAPSPCGGETQKVKKSPFPGPTRCSPPRLPGFPARRPSRASAPPPLPASQTHFCSKAAMSLESRMFSSGSQVLYLPSYTCRK